ncbi:MAG: acyltransferase family protein, partial [Actinomycetota bacterium]
MAESPRAYSPALDGLRALAVSAVVVYHFAPGVLPAGFLGVDVFFVVSGFLITRILVTELGLRERIGLRSFWARRIRRLLPALALLTVVTVTGAAVLMTALERRGLPAQTVGTLTFSLNWVLIGQSGDYFATVGRPSPLLHLWSLAIEEQFYVVLPLVLLAARRVVGRRPHVAAAVALGAAGLSAVAMAAVAGSGAGTSRAYLGTTTHASALLVGTALGLVAERAPGRRVPAGSPVAVGALLVITATMLGADDRSLWVFRGGFLAFAIVTGLVVALVVDRPAAIPARALAARPLVAL